ncbi:MAG: uracil-DNA glycosylase [Ruminococcus sp.]|nr:uracil-DNA glycosylase [Ruminococcus sp.]
MVNFGNEWDEILKDEFVKDYYLQLRKTLIQEYRTQQIFPGMYDIYNAMKLTSYSDVRCVILGQDPYHGEGQAHGLSFSVRKGIAPPPSLVNIFKEIRDDVGINNLGKHGELTKWAQEGVLLLNSVLTVRANQARSHHGIGWEQFTTDVIKVLNERQKPMVFMLWGGDAKQKAQFITNPNHLILRAAHPSPLSAYNGFFGCHHFSQANKFLSERGLGMIDWSID